MVQISKLTGKQYQFVNCAMLFKSVGWCVMFKIMIFEEEQELFDVIVI